MEPRHIFIKNRATYSQGIPRPGTCTFDLDASPEEIFAVMEKAPAPFMKRTKQGVYIELQPRDVHVSIDAGMACKGVGTPEEEYMELDHLQMVNFGVGFHVPRVANTDEPEQVAINLQLILHEPGEALPFVLVEMYRYKDNSANIQIETLSGIQVQEPVTTHGAFVEFQADQRAGRFRILFDGVEKWSTTYRAKVSPRFVVGVRAGTKIRIADSARIMLVTAPEQFSFKVPNPWRSICERGHGPVEITESSDQIPYYTLGSGSGETLPGLLAISVPPDTSDFIPHYTHGQGYMGDEEFGVYPFVITENTGHIPHFEFGETVPEIKKVIE